MKRLVVVVFCFFAINAWSQTKTVKILTSAECVAACCKERIEEEMKWTKGVTSVNHDIKSKTVTVSFKEKKTNLKKIRSKISMLGYDADGVQADKKAHYKLPVCCQNSIVINRY